MDFARQILQQPLWVQLWVAWMIGINSACVLFLRRVEARWVLAAWMGNLLTMQALFALRQGGSRGIY